MEDKIRRLCAKAVEAKEPADAVPINAPSIIEHLAGGSDIAIVFGLVSKTLGTEERNPLSVDTVSGPHVGE